MLLPQQEATAAVQGAIDTELTLWSGIAVTWEMSTSSSIAPSCSYTVSLPCYQTEWQSHEQPPAEDSRSEIPGIAQGAGRAGQAVLSNSIAPPTSRVGGWDFLPQAKVDDLNS